MEHYYSKKHDSDLNESVIEWTVGGLTLRFATGSGVFSRGGVDFGTHLLIETLLEDLCPESKTLLDIGCGYGPIGIFTAAHDNDLMVHMADVNERAVELASRNIELNGIGNAKAFLSDVFSDINGRYDVIASNPPVRAGKKTVFSFYEGAFAHLEAGGSFYCVIQKKQGADSSAKKLTELFGNCETINRKSGYRIFRAKKMPVD